jgi:hypothetical protein
MNELEIVKDQERLPHFDQYFKHNDYIQNFELAAAMDITQHRVFDTLMSCVQTLKYHKHDYLFENNTGGKTIKLNLDFFMQRYLKSHKIKNIKKSELRMAVKSLAEIVVVKDTKEGIVARPVFQEVFANTKYNRLEIEISKYFSYDSLAPGKDTKSPGYTKLLSSNQAALKSVYARIFYQYFLSKLAFQNNIEIEIEIPKLHKILGLVNEEGKFLKGKKGYAETSQFKRRCIKESKELINNHTELDLDIIDIKNGRKLVAFLFKVKFKEKEKTNNGADNQLDELKPKKEDFKSKDDFIKYMKIYYKNSKITNMVPNCPISDYIVLDKNGMLCLENKEKGIYRYSDNNKIDYNFSQKIWSWLYDNIDRVGRFKQISQIDIINDKYKDEKVEINNNIFACENIKKDKEYWIVTVKNENDTAKIKIPLKEKIEEYLESIKV